MGFNVEDLGHSAADVTLMKSTLPGFVIGGYVSGWVGGMVVVEAIRVLYRYPKDHIALRLFVCVIMFLSLFHTSSYVPISYHYAISGFGHFQAMDVAIPAVGLHIMLSRTCITTSQFFFTYRLFLFSNRNVFITVLSALLALHHLIVSILVSVSFVKAERYSQLSLPVALYLLYSAAIACDVFITISLCIFLRSQKTKYTNTRSIINRIMRRSFQTNLYTTVFAVGSMTILGRVGVGVLYSFTLPGSQMYLLSVVLTLQSRASLAKALERSSERTMASSITRPTITGTTMQESHMTGTRPDGFGIRVDQVIITNIDRALSVACAKSSELRPTCKPSPGRAVPVIPGLQASDGMVHEALYPPRPNDIENLGSNLYKTTNLLSHVGK